MIIIVFDAGERSWGIEMQKFLNVGKINPD